jgi:hypothetical protein
MPFPERISAPRHACCEGRTFGGDGWVRWGCSAVAVRGSRVVPGGNGARRVPEGSHVS